MAQLGLQAYMNDNMNLLQQIKVKSLNFIKDDILDEYFLYRND